MNLNKVTVQRVSPLTFPLSFAASALVVVQLTHVAASHHLGRVWLSFHSFPSVLSLAMFLLLIMAGNKQGFTCRSGSVAKWLQATFILPTKNAIPPLLLAENEPSSGQHRSD